MRRQDTTNPKNRKEPEGSLNIKNNRYLTLNHPA
jgi:hypothetical protein